MKIQNNIVYISAFVYILFSYATILPESAIDVHSWIIIIVVNFRIALFLCFFTINNRQILPLADLVLIFCIIFLMAEQIIKINRYMKTYHRQSPVWVNYIITLAVIIIVHSYDIKKTEKTIAILAQEIEDSKYRMGKTKANAYNTNMSTLARIKKHKFANIPIEKVAETTYKNACIIFDIK